MENVKKYSAGKSYKVVAFCVSNFSGDETARLVRSARKLSKEYGCKLVFFSTISDFYYDDINDAGAVNNREGFKRFSLEHSLNIFAP